MQLREAPIIDYFTQPLDDDSLGLYGQGPIYLALARKCGVRDQSQQQGTDRTSGNVPFREGSGLSGICCASVAMVAMVPKVVMVAMVEKVAGVQMVLGLQRIRCLASAHGAHGAHGEHGTHGTHGAHGSRTDYAGAHGTPEGTSCHIKNIRRPSYGIRDDRYFLLKIWERSRRHTKCRDFSSPQKCA